MRLFLASAAWLFAIAAAASNSSSCTTFIGKQAGCCPPASSSTAYTGVNCHGCSLATTTTGIHCMMVCNSPSPIIPLHFLTHATDLPDRPSNRTRHNNAHNLLCIAYLHQHHHHDRAFRLHHHRTTYDKDRTHRLPWLRFGDSDDV